MTGRRAEVAHRRKADAGVLGNHDDIAEQHQVGAYADAGAVDLRDHRFVHVEDLHSQPLALFQAPDIVVNFLAAAVVGAFADVVFGQIGPGAEMRPGTTQYHAMHGVMLVRLQQRSV